MTNRKPLFIILFSLGYSGIYSQEQQVKKDSVYQLQEIVVSSQQILGSKFKARNRTGSAYYISPEEIRRLGYTDINRMLKAVPGVNMYEEDGFGLRPNISLRGTKAERSERISIMEDGVLAAPAPYSAPAAYYFPNVARMEVARYNMVRSLREELLIWYRLLFRTVFPVKRTFLTEAKIRLSRIHLSEAVGSISGIW